MNRMLYTIAKGLITRGAYVRETMLQQLGVLMMYGQITPVEYEELANMMPAE